jgi:hypothetical protein
MAFARTAAVSGAGTVSCAGTTTVTGSGTAFASGLGGAPALNAPRVGGTITVGGVTKTIVAIASTTSLTVDTAFGTFSGQAFTCQTGVIQTGTDIMNLSLGEITGFLVTNRADLLRIFDVRGQDLFIEGTLTVQSQVAQLRNDGSCSNRFEVIGSATGGNFTVNGRKAAAANAPFPYPGLDWLGQNGQKIMKLKSTNASFPALFTIIDACIRYGSDWLTTDSGNFSKITTQGDICWILGARGTGTSQARLRQDNTTASIDFQANKTFLGVWLNFGVPQFSLRGYTPIDTDGPEINLASVPLASLITIDNYNTTHVLPSYYAGVQIVLLGSAWTRLKNNLLGTNIAWRSSSAVSGRHNVIEFSKQITSRIQDTAGNLLSDGFMYYQPIGSNVAGVRGKGMTTDITFDLSQQNIATVAGAATSEFRFAWGFTTATTNLSTYNYFCTGQTKGAETHLVGSSRYGYDKQYITVGLAGNNDATPTYVHTSLPTSDKVIATAAAISGIAFNFTTKTMTITGNLTYQQIYDAYQYALNQTANLFQADNCITINAKSNYVGWTINVATGVTIDTGSGNFTTLQAQTITLTGTAQITGIYQDSTGTSTVLEISGFDAGSAVYVEDNNEVQKFYSASTSGTVTVYIPPTGTGSWYYAVEKYGIQRQSDFFTFSGGLKEIVVKAIPDIGLTQTNVATVAAYTALENPDKIYDYVAYLRTTTPHISYGQILFKDGTSLYLADASMLVDQSFGSVASFNYDTKLLTIKSLVLETGVSYTKIVADPPASVTANTNEIITILIEDANGDSRLSILGGDNEGYELWKVTTATATDDYASGTLLITLPNNSLPYRFIGISGFDIVGRDTSSGVRRRSSMLKGTYNQAFYVGNQIQLATDAPQLEENNQKLDELILKVDNNLDVAVSTRLAAINYVEPDNDGIADANTKLDALENYDDTILQGKVDAIKTKVDTLENTDLTGIALEATSQEILTTVQDIDVDFTPVLDAIDLTLKTSQYTAPDNVKIGQIKTKVDTLENTNISTLATTVQLEAAKDEILANSSGATPEEIADQVWLDQPDRLKNVSTVQITGEQLKTYIDQ